jgi:hypothetical protein
MLMIRNGQEQFERQPVKFSSKEQAERTFREHTVKILKRTQPALH